MDKLQLKYCIYYGSWLVWPFIAWLMWRLRQRERRWLVATLLAGCLVFAWARFVEPQRIRVQETALVGTGGMARGGSGGASSGGRAPIVRGGNGGKGAESGECSDAQGSPITFPSCKRPTFVLGGSTCSEAETRQLLRRTGFGVNPTLFAQITHNGETCGQAADRLLDFKPTGFKPKGSYIDLAHNKWIKYMTRTSRELQEKLVLFWHDHFATNFNVVADVKLMANQNRLFREKRQHLLEHRTALREALHGVAQHLHGPHDLQHVRVDEHPLAYGHPAELHFVRGISERGGQEEREDRGDHQAVVSVATVEANPLVLGARQCEGYLLLQQLFGREVLDRFHRK